jgi:hypothetical protein
MKLTRIDTDVLDWYRQQGGGYLTRMNAVLRSFMEQMGQRQSPPSPTEDRSQPAPKRRSSAAKRETASSVPAHRSKTS